MRNLITISFAILLTSALFAQQASINPSFSALGKTTTIGPNFFYMNSPYGNNTHIGLKSNLHFEKPRIGVEVYGLQAVGSAQSLLHVGVAKEFTATEKLSARLGAKYAYDRHWTNYDFHSISIGGMFYNSFAFAGASVNNIYSRTGMSGSGNSYSLSNSLNAEAGFIVGKEEMSSFLFSPYVKFQNYPDFRFWNVGFKTAVDAFNGGIEYHIAPHNQYIGLNFGVLADPIKANIMFYRGTTGYDFYQVALGINILLSQTNEEHVFNQKYFRLY